MYPVVSQHPVQDTLGALLHRFSVRYKAEAFFVEFHVLVVLSELLQVVLQPARSSSALVVLLSLLLLLGGGLGGGGRRRLAFYRRHDDSTGER